MSAARSIVGILLLFLLSFSSLPVAQSRADARLRLVSVRQGEAIVQAAWELRRGLNPKPDCSHFVQAVYAKAGFPYEYAATREIFAGADSFRRVQKPQPGDLVVWQGHIGIVIDPSEHSFYSSVLSGFAIENYRSHYWEARGDPRFYRFVVNDLQKNDLQKNDLQKNDLQKVPKTKMMTLRAGATEVHPASNQAPLQHAQRSAASSQKPGVMATVADSRESTSRQPVQIADSTQSVSRQPAQIAVQPRVQMKAEVEAGAGKMATQDAAIHNEIFVTSHATPSRRDVLAAINWFVNDYGERLLRDRLLDSQPSVGVADKFSLVSLNVQGNSGLADVEVQEIAAFQYGKPASTRLIAKQRVILSRQQQGWMLLLPQDLMYLNRRMAAVALTDQLATLSKGPADQLRAKKTTKILRELLSVQNAGAKTAGVNTGASD